MKRRVFLGLVTAALPANKIGPNRLQRALDELELSIRAAYGEVRFEIALEETERTPLLIHARRV